MRPSKKFHTHGVRFITYLCAALCLYTTSWIRWKFGSPTTDQILYHLQHLNEGFTEADPSILDSFLKYVLIRSCVLSMILYVVHCFFLSKDMSTFIEICKKKNLFLGGVLGSTASCVRKSFQKFIPIGVLFFSGFLLANEIALWSYLNDIEESTFFEEHYKEPKNIVAPSEKLNLVLIYVESLENGFSDPYLMGKDLLQSLNEATKDAYRFNNYMQTTGTGWTIAGIVSSQCGIPLKSYLVYDGNTQGEKVHAFLPKATCLGDILSLHGYTNVFLGGASLQFSGKGKFLAQHGYSELYGKEQWARMGENTFHDWGIYDDTLFAHAKSKLDLLEQSNTPFNLTLLTVDTHFPEGYYSPTCINKGAKNYKDIVSCTADQLTDFIHYMDHKGYLKNTLVVILGDHLAMGVPVYDALKSGVKRTVFNRFISPHRLIKNSDRMYHFSSFPSILYAMNFRFDQNRLGLGASGFGPVDKSYEIPSFHTHTFKELLSKSSKKYRELWTKREQTR